MSRRYPVLLLDDILDCIDAIQEFITDKTVEDILSSRIHKDAIIRNLEVLGEAANQLPKETQALASEIPWARIVALRNRLIHEYHGINWKVMIPIILEELPRLKIQLEALQELLPVNTKGNV